MGLFKWFRKNEEENELGKIIVDLSQVLKHLNRIRFPVTGIYAIPNDFFRYRVFHSKRWLEEALKRAYLLIDELNNKKSPKSYRGKSQLTVDEEDLLLNLLFGFINDGKKILEFLKYTEKEGSVYSIVIRKGKFVDYRDKSTKKEIDEAKKNINKERDVFVDKLKSLLDDLKNIKKKIK